MMTHPRPSTGPDPNGYTAARIPDKVTIGIPYGRQSSDLTREYVPSEPADRTLMRAVITDLADRIRLSWVGYGTSATYTIRMHTAGRSVLAQIGWASGFTHAVYTSRPGVTVTQPLRMPEEVKQILHESTLTRCQDTTLLEPLQAVDAAARMAQAIAELPESDTHGLWLGHCAGCGAQNAGVRERDELCLYCRIEKEAPQPRSVAELDALPHEYKQYWLHCDPNLRENLATAERRARERRPVRRERPTPLSP